MIFAFDNLSVVIQLLAQ